jgi:hypothetical protein
MTPRTAVRIATNKPHDTIPETTTAQQRREKWEDQLGEKNQSEEQLL